MKLVKRVFSATSAAVIGLSTLMTMGFTGAVGAAGLNCTWTGATNDNFNTAGNWSNCYGGVPGTGDNLVFDITSLSASKTLMNDIGSLSVANITFQGSNSNYYRYTIGGNDLTVTSAITNNMTSNGAIFSSPLTLSGSVSLGGVGYIDFGGAVGGGATITKTGESFVYFESDGSLSGTITANAGTVSVTSAAGLGTAAVIINDGADISIGGCGDASITVANDLTLQGAGHTYSGSTEQAPKLTTGSICKGAGGGSDESYGQVETTNAVVSLSGAVNLLSDVSFAGMAKTTYVTGALSGHKFTLDPSYSGTLVVNSGNNTSALANGTYKPDPIVATLSDNQPTHTVFIYSGAVVTIDGARGDTQVGSGGTLKGTGTIGVLTVGGTVAPGHSPGCITSGNLSISGTYQAEIGGETACTGYDQLKVNGTVTLNNATLATSLYGGFLPKQGTTYTIIANDGNDAVTGTFKDLAEGATFKVSDGVFKISYAGGDGNDVVLSVVTAPTTPDTGFAFVGTNPAALFGGAVLAAGAIVLVARKMRPTPVRVRAASRRRR